LCIAVIAVAAVSAMSAVHKHMHQGASEQQQPYPIGRQPPGEVCPVLGNKEIRGDDEETDKYPFRHGFCSGAAIRFVLVIVVHEFSFVWMGYRRGCEYSKLVFTAPVEPGRTISISMR
jgi:hypothetical protein